MDHLIGPNVQVVLALKEGKGFDKLTNPIIIIATLNNLSLESDLIDPNSSPQYDTDLVWEANKTILRKMRSGQEPLKIEFFECKVNGTKNKIGYLLLSLRTAQIIPNNKNINEKINWHKLLGCRGDMKYDKPEIFLSLTIRERDLVDVITTNPKDMELITSIPYLIHEEALIQLGPIDTCREIFLLSIVPGNIGNIDILDKQTVCNNTNNHKEYTFWYNILENQVQSKAFTANSQICSLNEKIVIRIRSSLNIIKNYFQIKPHCIVILKHIECVLGQSVIDLRPLIPTDIIEDLLENYPNGITIINHHCILNTLDSKNEIFNIEDKPFVDLQITLKYIGLNTVNDLQVDPITEFYRRPSCSCPSICNKDSGHVMNKVSQVDCHRHPSEDFHNCTVPARIDSNRSRHEHITSLNSTEKCADIPHVYNERAHSKSIEAYHCYCLHVTLNSVKLGPAISIQRIEFRFHHPKAEIMSTLYPKMPILPGEQLKLQDIGCKLHFISAVEEIRQLLLSFPPKISICDGDRTEKSCMGQSILDVGRLFEQTKLECHYEAPLLHNNHIEIGSLQVIMRLEDHGPYYRANKQRGENLGPPILDDSLAYKIVDELETWKERQQELFRLELKRKEERHLNRLSEEWQKRKEGLEARLACSMEQCKLLANNLNLATDDLRTRRMQGLEKEAHLIKTNEDLKWTYDRKSQELKEASHKMQQDYSSKLIFVEEQNKKLEAQIQLTMAENTRLQLIVKKQNDDIGAYKKGLLTQDQTADLLQELKGLERKLNSAQKSKTFFKEQWGKAVREIHKMKMEHRQAIEVQIKTSKEELKHIDLEEILHSDSTALSNDKILLGQIQKEIDVIRPKPSFVSSNPEESMFTPAYNSATRSHVSFRKPQSSVTSNEQDQRLRKIIEERDALLKTGSYTIDDAIIIKLNTEIRSLFINS